MVTKGSLLKSTPSRPSSVERMQASVASSRAARAGERQSDAGSASYDRMAKMKKSILSSSPTSRWSSCVPRGREQGAVRRASTPSISPAHSSATHRVPRRLHLRAESVASRGSVGECETAIQGTMNKDAATLLTIADMSVLETR